LRISNPLQWIGRRHHRDNISAFDDSYQVPERFGLKRGAAQQAEVLQMQDPTSR
jgi:hypothetical protein